MAISDSRLLEFLACPQDKGKLLYLEAEDVLYNPRLKAKYQIKDGIPVLLASEATTVDAAEHDRLVAAAEAAGQSVD
ncbi:MAG: Trm112 family protein [Actinobacteria bacterium]|nr:Trm112 family protein [Actinomycetota bacterium]